MEFSVQGKYNCTSMPNWEYYTIFQNSSAENGKCLFKKKYNKYKWLKWWRNFYKKKTNKGGWWHKGNQSR